MKEFNSKNKITFDELLNELEQYRQRPKTRIKITNEQKIFLLKARDNKNPVSWKQIAELWSKMWYPISSSTVAARYDLAKMKNAK